ncbi:Dynamin-1-like protein [Orchesella cincta]|uniref:Dynamin-1-like protein n=1 Tax=Orchesella cincta TaxID=48709 RepID=A0A1D2MA77_ORCCI|nr:Dynamin-1-like protein [Orchesella cincta]
MVMDDSREVIELVNKLQTYFKSTGCRNQKIELPQIVVVGAQSSGKSSVLDGLVGFSILPRGSGTVTKCPIIVQLITISGESEEEGIELEDYPEDGRINDNDDVRAKITELMEKNNGAITDTPIIVRVYSPHVVTLTVVDLPGIKRLTSAGEPSDLEKLIFDLSRKYINEKNAIILAVSPANYDICNSDGLLLAKEADPEGNRTIGVLTKLDLMDEGTDARDLLTGVSKDVQVKLGMIGLVNRSQKDIDNNFTVEQQMIKEKSFLSDTYPDLVDENGVPFLRKRLHELLVQHIHKCLPEILDKLEDLLEACTKRLDEIPNVLTQKDQFAFVSKIIYRFENHMKKELEGSPRSPEYDHLYGGIKIKEIFETLFARDMDAAAKKSDASITDAMILTAFRNSGSYDSMFVYPEAVFKRLALYQLQHIERPALKCAEMVNDQIMKIAERNLTGKNSNAFKHFPELRKLLKSVVTTMLISKLDDVKRLICDYVRVQSSVVFSMDERFKEKIADLKRKLERELHLGEEVVGTNNGTLPHVPIHSNSSSPTRSLNFYRPEGSNRNDPLCVKLKNPLIIKYIKEMVKYYFRLIKSQTQDYIPKLVDDRLIRQFSSDGSLGEELRTKVIESYEALTQLPLNVRESRKKDEQSKEHLKEVIAEVKAMLNSYLVNKLQAYFKSTGCRNQKIELPQIVVVGAQSSGKSSVLDGLVGFSILPRGSGTVTKCPIIVQLMTINSDIEDEGIELEDFPKEGRMQDYDEVRAKITELMEKNDGAITDNPIILTSTGEPSDLEQLIFALSRKYIQQKNAIILAVSPANYDICNSDGLLLAKEADPKGNRTIGVLTKLDLMDEGTDARDLLTGVSNDVQVKLGMIGLVNRSQKDIDNNFTVEDQLIKEETFLSKNYPDLVNQNGVPFLRKRLHELLVQHILKCLPEMLEKFEDLLEGCNKRLADIPDVMTQKDQFAFVSKIIQRFENHMRTEIEGSPRSPEYDHLYGGIKIKDIFEKHFAKEMQNAVRKSDASITDEMILTAFRNSGSYDSMFVNPEAVFRKLAQNQLQHIEKPAIKCAVKVNDEIMKIADRNLGDKNGNSFKYFPELRKLLKNIVTNMLDDKLDAVKAHIADYIRVQSSVVFSLDDRFLLSITGLRRKLEKQLHGGDEDSDGEKAKQELTNGEIVSQVGFPQSDPIYPFVHSKPPPLNGNGFRSELATAMNQLTGADRLCIKLKNPAIIKLIKEMVKQYFQLIRSQTQDYIPKLVADRLITQFSSDGNLVEELRTRVMENYESLTQLPTNIKESRSKDMKFKEHLKEAIAEVKGVLNSYNYEEDDLEIELENGSEDEFDYGCADEI